MNLQMKLFSLLLIFLLLLAMPFGNVVSANVTEATSYQTISDARLLNALGIISADADSENFQEEVTRAFFAVTVARIFGVSTVSEQSFYADMDGMDAEIVSAVNHLTSMSFISGDENNCFLPNQSISLFQALKILVCATGFRYRAESLGGYPYGFVSQAVFLGITKGITNIEDMPLTKAQLVAILKNALNTEILQETTFGESPEYKTIRGETLLGNVMHIIVLKSVTVTANAVTALNGGDGVGKNFMQIDGKLYKDPIGFGSQYIGRTVDAYISEDSDQTILYVAQDSVRSSLQIDFEDILQIDATQITYLDEKDETRTAHIFADANMVFNGEASLYRASAIDLSANGDVLLERSENAMNYDFVTVEEYTYAVMDSVDYDKQILYDSIPNGQPIDLKRYITDDRCSIWIDKAESTLEEIPTDSLLTIYKAPSDGYIRIVVSGDKITGIIEEIGEDRVVIDGNEYALSSDIAQDMILHKNSVCTAYLNQGQKIVWFKTEKRSEIVYGYLIDGKVNTDMDQKTVLKILTEDGSVEALTVSDTVKIKKSGAEKPSSDSVKNILAPDGEWQQQLLQYKLNAGGEIAQLQTATDSQTLLPEQYREEVFNCSIPKSYLKYKSSRSFHAKFLMDDDTKIFVIPKTDSKKEDDFAAKDASYFINDNFYFVSAFNVDFGGVAEAVVCWGDINDKAPDFTSESVMVDSVGEALNASGDSVQKLYGMQNGKFVSYYTDGETKLCTQTRLLKRGDVIRICLNPKSEITGVAVDVDIDTYKENGASFSTLWNERWAVSGAFYSMENGNALVSTNIGEVLSATFDTVTIADLMAISIGGTVMIYNRDLDQVYAGTLKDIMTYKSAGENASRFFITFRYESPTNIFIFK